MRLGLLLGAVVVAVACHREATAPGNPTPGDTVKLVASLPIPPNYGIHDTFVRGGVAFVFAWNSGVMIYDVGNGIKGGSPTSPQLISTLITNASGIAAGADVHNGWWFWGPTGEKKYLFIGQEGPAIGGIGVGSCGLIHVVDVSDLAHPTEVAYFHKAGTDSTGTHNFWVDETNQILYAAYYNGGVVALDVSGTLSGDLSSRLIDSLRIGGPGNTYTWGVQLYNGSLYAVDMLSGLWQLNTVSGDLSVAGWLLPHRQRARKRRQSLAAERDHGSAGPGGLDHHVGDRDRQRHRGEQQREAADVQHGERSQRGRVFLQSRRPRPPHVPLQVPGEHRRPYRDAGLHRRARLCLRGKRPGEPGVDDLGCDELDAVRRQATKLRSFKNASFELFFARRSWRRAFVVSPMPTRQRAIAIGRCTCAISCSNATMRTHTMKCSTR